MTHFWKGDGPPITITSPHSIPTLAPRDLFLGTSLGKGVFFRLDFAGAGPLSVILRILRGSSIAKLRLCMRAQSLSHVPLCDLMNYDPPVSCVCGILLARILEWVAISLFSGS